MNFGAINLKLEIFKR